MYFWSNASHYRTSWQPCIEPSIVVFTASVAPPHLPVLAASASFSYPSTHPVKPLSCLRAISPSTFLSLTASPLFLFPLSFKTLITLGLTQCWTESKTAHKVASVSPDRYTLLLCCSQTKSISPPCPTLESAVHQYPLGADFSVHHCEVHRDE